MEEIFPTQHLNFDEIIKSLETLERRINAFRRK